MNVKIEGFYRLASKAVLENDKFVAQKCIKYLLKNVKFIFKW